MTVAEIAAAVGGAVVGDGSLVVTGAEVDSRHIRGGDLFVALAGARSDGHDHLGEALARAVAALVRADLELPPPPSGRALIRVDDPLAAYHDLARRERARQSWEVVAVTGSVAKTTTKDLLAALIGRHRATGASQGNRNSTLGLPAQLLSQVDEIEVFVAEAGMSRAGELTVLGEMLRPTRLLYTRIAAVHTEFFDDGLAGVVRAKAELLPYLDPQGVLVVNGADPNQRTFADQVSAKVVRYGTPDAEMRIEDLEDRGLLGSRFQLVLAGGRAEIDLPLAGRHQSENLLAAAACAATLGMTASDVAAIAPKLESAPRRGRVHRMEGGVTLVDDSYNASPEAVMRALELLARAPGRRIAVLGEMYELGPGSAEAHRKVGGLAVAACDQLVVVGAADAAELAAGATAGGLGAASIHRAADAEGAAALVQRLIETGDVVLVKGSRGVGLDRTVDRLLGREVA